MDEYFVPAGPGESELAEKRSRFLGHVLPVSSEQEARDFIDRMKRTYHDARHNCWCYLLREGGAARSADDGEPQGTAGPPMLGVFQKEGVFNVCCVVTRYFGGVLLGPGGLVRAYTRAAKDALDAAGKAPVRRWVRVRLSCPYPVLEQVKLTLQGLGGELESAGYGEAVSLSCLLPGGTDGAFSARVHELSAGRIAPQTGEEVFRAGGTAENV